MTDIILCDEENVSLKREKPKRRKKFVSYEQFTYKTRRRFPCDICKCSLSSKETLRKHILIKHIRLKPHACTLCCESFIFKKSLITHQEAHFGNTPLICHCGKPFKRKASYDYHNKYSHPHGAPSSTFRCTLCNKLCKDKKQLRYHVDSTHAAKSIPCTSYDCKKSFSTKSLLHHHLKTHSLKRYKCPICENSFKHQSYLERHIATHNDVRPYRCEECSSSYSTSSHLSTHKKRVHKHSDGYLCSVCGKTSRHKYDIILHERSHLEENKFECSLCDFKANFKASLTHHQKKHLLLPKTPEWDTSSYIKPSRSVAEKNRKNTQHYVFRDHLEINPFKCIDCNNAFKTAVRANEHWRRYHFVKSAFKCSFCKKWFPDETSLGAHKLLHSDEETFECEFCDYKTAFRIGLQSHLKIHSNTSQQKKKRKRKSNLLSFSSNIENVEKEHVTNNTKRNANGSIANKNKRDEHEITDTSVATKDDLCFNMIDSEAICAYSGDLIEAMDNSELKVNTSFSDSIGSLVSTQDYGYMLNGDNWQELSSEPLVEEHLQQSLQNKRLETCNAHDVDWVENMNFHSPTSSSIFRSFADKSSHFRRGLNTTLNCTAVHENDVNFHSSHFI